MQGTVTKYSVSVSVFTVFVKLVVWSSMQTFPCPATRPTDSLRNAIKNPFPCNPAIYSFKGIWNLVTTISCIVCDIFSIKMRYYILAEIGVASRGLDDGSARIRSCCGRCCETRTSFSLACRLYLGVPRWLKQWWWTLLSGCGQSPHIAKRVGRCHVTRARHSAPQRVTWAFLAILSYHTSKTGSESLSGAFSIHV